MADAVDQLRDILAKGNALIICGAGVSAALTGGKAPGWQALIEGAVGFGKREDLFKTSDLDDIERWLASGTDTEQWLKAAETVRKKLKSRFRECLGELLEPLCCRNDQLMQMLVQLQKAGNAIATTNYDDLLANGLGKRAVTWMHPVDAMKVVKCQTQNVLHIHGHWSEPDSVVFSESDYERVTDAEKSQFVQKLIIHHRTVVFLGSSTNGLHDANMGKLLQWFTDEWRDLGESHFVLVRKGEDTGWPRAVKPIVYGKEHDDLAAFLAGLAPKPKAAKPFPPNPRMLGRADMLEEVVTHVLADGHRPLIISGGPGMGKSTLAVQAAHDARVIARFGVAGRYFVRLDSATDAESMLALLAADLGVATTGNVIANVATALTKPTLVILDNLETPFQRDKKGVEEKLSQLGGIGTLTLVNTVRGATPHVAGGAREISEIKKLEPPYDRDLFVREAGGKVFNEQELRDLLGAMEGHALSIVILGRLASGNVNLPLLRRRWIDEKAVLLNGGDDRLDNVIVSLKLSLDVLTDDAQRLARLVALLPDGLALAHAKAVLGKETDKAVMALVKAGLADERAERLYMLAPLREAVKQCLPSVNADMMKAADQFLKLLKKADGIGTDDWPAAQEEVLADANNLNDMLALVTNHGDSNWIAPAAIGLAEFHSFSGLASVTSLAAAVASLDAETHAKDKALCILSLGDIALRRSDHKGARAKYEEALPLFRKLGDVQGKANCIERLGDIALERSDHAGAAAKYEVAQPLHRKVGNVQGEANCIRSLGDIALARSDHETARAKYEEAQQLYRQVGDVLGVAACIARLGDIAFARSDHAGARVKYEEALPLFRKVGDVLGETNCIRCLGDIALERSDHALARAKYEEALPLFRKVGHLPGEAVCIARLGECALALSQHEVARAKYEEAQLLFRKVGDVLGEANCIRSLGDIALARPDLAEARAKYEEALPLYRKVGAVLGEANCIQRLGDIALRRSDHEGARAKYEEALPLYRKVGDVLGEANCIQGLGDIALDRSDHVGARAKYEEALPLYRKVGSVLGEANCIGSLGDIAEQDGRKAEAKEQWQKALALYGRIPEPYSMGNMHRRLARVTKGKVRDAHVAEARRLWRSIDREDLVKEWLPE